MILLFPSGINVLNDKSKNLGRCVVPVYGVDFFAMHVNILQSCLLAMSGTLCISTAVSGFWK